MKTISFRPATQSDALHIARLYSIASDGVSDYLWSTLAAPGEDVQRVGARQIALRSGHFSYANTLIVEVNDDIAGLMLSFPMSISDSDTGENAGDIDPVMAPFNALEENNSLYIAGMMVLDAYRGHSLGKLLMILAEQAAKDHGLDKLSMIVFEENALAMSHYKKQGFKEIKRVKSVPHPLIRHQGDLLLMVKILE